MKTLGEVLQLTVQCLKEKQIVRARRVSEELIAHVLHLSRLDLYMQFDKPLLEEELKILRELVKRALKNEPIEYILGRVSFYGCSIEVTSDVLIPRQETEILLEKADLRLKQGNLEG